MNTAVARLNPFTDLPVPPELFVGRSAQLGAIRRSLEEVLLGQPRHILIIGDRGMGKSSIAQYVENLASDVRTGEDGGKRVFPVFVSLADCRNVDDVCLSVISRTHAKLKVGPQIILNKFMEFLRSLNEFGVEVGITGVGFNLSRDNAPHKDMHLRFDDVLIRMASSLPDEYGALLIILDELDFISSIPEFAPFLKGLIEKLSRQRAKQVSLFVTVSPLQRQELEKSHETVIRSFVTLEIGTFSEQETGTLIDRALTRGVPLKRADADFMVDVQHYCSGIPYFIHEVGKAAFESDRDNILDHDDFVKGVLGTQEVVGAMKNLEIKHFRKRYEEDVLSNSYRRMLQAIASFSEDIVTVKELKPKLGAEDQKRLSVYLTTMVKRGVLKKMPGVKGQYSLPDRLFKIFLRMQSVEKK